jgi:hypothetical protein
MLRQIVSLSIAWMFVTSAISGVMLYIAPPGRIAHWAGWHMWGLDKTSWDHIHTVTTLLMIIAALLHLYYNWKPFVSYMKDRVTKTISATKALLFSVLLTGAIILGALVQAPPFNLIIDWGDTMSESWELSYGTPPYNHAELDTVALFTQRLGLDQLRAEADLKAANITYAPDASLLMIAIQNHTTPQGIYEIIKGEKAVHVPLTQSSGMGRKTIAQFCELRGLALPVALERLKSKGIDAQPSEKVKELAEKIGMNPIDLVAIMEASE